MTKAEAATIISRAILAEGNQQHILGADAFAQRLATALDALGLLVLATDPTHEPNEREIIYAAARIASESPLPLATSSTSERHSLTEQDQPTEWATTRARP